MIADPGRYTDPDETLRALNDEWRSQNDGMMEKFAVLFLGNAAPGGNNIIDGLLKY